MATNFVICDDGINKLETVSDTERFTIRQVKVALTHLPCILPREHVSEITLKDYSHAAQLCTHLGVWLTEQRKRGKL